ncbi:exopolyphosphatase-like protein [Xylaria cf. heliscus]|nr:exopolyphosphatase-like protein [Xylaria cf. heliscus]
MSEMPPRASLKTFLTTARAALRAPPSKRTVPLTFVVGNESADLDSLCSALLLAYFHTYSPLTKRALSGDVGNSGANNNNNNTSNLHIPVCHLERADLALRPEFAAVLRDAEIKGEDVFTLEDVLPSNYHHSHRHHHEGSSSSNSGGSSSGGAPLHPEDTRWLLVDHNAMTGILGKVFGSRVIGCVDHHADEDVVPRDAALRVVEKSGSCASLVVEGCADIWEALAGSTPTSPESGKMVDAQLARLALAPILIDTANLKDGTKTTAHDERAVGIAEGKISVDVEMTGGEGEGEGEGGEGKYERDTFFKRIADLKEDIAEMSFRDVFRKDYKEWSVGNLRLGTSSSPRGFDYLVDTKSSGDAAVFASALGEWGDEKDALGKMDLVTVFTGFQDEGGRFRRELLVWARSEAGIKAAKLFEESWGKKLGLESWRDGVLDTEGDGDWGGWRRCWAQGAVEHSRKQIAPMLRDALKEVSGGG